MNILKNAVITTLSAAITATCFIAPVYGTVVQADRLADEAEIECLALNIYYEARGSNLADKAAVADVVMNRTQDRRYPATICGVVQDGYKKGRRDCQFSWYCDGKSDNPQDVDRWMEAQSIAFSMVEFGDYRGITEGSTHYHADYVNPFWASSLQMVGRIGSHIFYRWEN